MDRGTFILLVVIAAAPIAALLFAGAFGLLDQLGEGGLSINDAPLRPPSRPDGPLARAEREAEIRQLVQARHDRQLARGEQPLDVEAEVSRLLAPDPQAHPDADTRQDPALREEVRQLAIARNERRAARREPPLDIDAEVERQLREIGA